MNQIDGANLLAMRSLAVQAKDSAITTSGNMETLLQHYIALQAENLRLREALEAVQADKEEEEQLKADREKLLQLLKSASEVIGRFVSDEGWAQSDMDTMDHIDAQIAALEAEQKPMNIDELHEQGLVSRYDMISEANNYRG